jgi:uncharacterized membrane protein
MLENLNWNTETILILGIVTFVAFALLGLVIWNAKTNKQVKTLLSIDDSLKHLDAVEPTTNATAAPTPEQPGESARSVPDQPADAIEEIKEPQSQSSVGRSGRVYTKEELEAQIR